MNMPAAFPNHAIEGMSETEDMLLGMVMALTAQLASTRERLDTLERLLAAQGLPGAIQIDAFMPDQAASAERDARRMRLIGRVFDPLAQSVERSIARKGRALE